LDEDYVEAGIEDVEEYVADLDEARVSSPQPFTIRTLEDQNRLQRLTGTTFSIGAHSENGFTQTPE
jgi:hypothetical protein